MDRPHVVLLGAGASRAACPDGDRLGYRLPLLKDIVEYVGLGQLLESAGVQESWDDFELLYSGLMDDGRNAVLVESIELAIFRYFANLSLPDEPTIYDHLVLSLRSKDFLATFNWDPFLWQAVNRCNDRLKGEVDLPNVLFLHGNTAIGYTRHDGRTLIGTLGRVCRANRKVFEQGPLLYPVAEKDYEHDERIGGAWDDLRDALRRCYLFTVFGYSAPVSDLAAIKLLQQAWGNRNDRTLEEIEIIDRVGVSEAELQARWSSFIYTHHFRTTDSFYSSILAESPRRSCEAIWGESVGLDPVHPNPLPWTADWPELIEAVKRR